MQSNSHYCNPVLLLIQYHNKLVIKYTGLLIFRGKKKQNFAGFSGANSRKNRPISRHFRGKKVKIRGTIGRFREIFAGEKSKFAEKSAHFAGFLRKKVNFRRIFGGKFLGKSADFTGNFGGKLRQQTISKRQPISLGFSFFWQISLKSINFASI